MASDKRSKKRKSFILKKDDGEKRRLYKRAAQMRRAAREPDRDPKHHQDWAAVEHWDDDDRPERTEKRKRARHDSLQVWAERLAGSETAPGAPSESFESPEGSEVGETGVVLTATSAACRVRLGDGLELECRLPRDLAAFQQSALAVGDRVVVTVDPGADTATVSEVLPRRSSLSRPDAGPGGEHRERVIAANVDVVVIVAAVADPPLRPRLLDRYLIAVEYGGALAAVALTKIDLLTDPDALAAVHAQLDGLHQLGVPILPTSVEDRSGIDALRGWLRGRTAVFVGQSGVGKSSLLNALEPTLGIATQQVGFAHKGRHTTTASTLHELADGTCIIDTPGVREFGLWQIERADLRRYFHEFDAHADACRFADCSHLHEPDCAVVRAVERGDVDAARYDGYRRIWNSLPT